MNSNSGTRTGFFDDKSWLILLVVVMVRIPFVLIHHVQEDAYITFRTARHLAEQGDFSYNLHQHFPATTSLLYPLIVAAMDLVFRSHMILAVQVLGILCVAFACRLAARALIPTGDDWQWVWLLLACWPVSLVVSYTGMETPLLLLALGAAMYSLRGEHGKMFVVSVLALPLIRPDAVAYGLVFCAAMLLVNRRLAAAGGAGLFAGVGLLLLGNRMTTGAFLPTTSRAKEIAYHPDHSVMAVLGRVRDLFLHQSFLLPVSTSYLMKLAPLMLLLVAAGFALAWRRAEGRAVRVLLAALGLLVGMVPIAYAAGGVIFDWYLFPANWLAIAVVLTAAVQLLARVRWRAVGWALVGLLWVGLAALQWTRSLAASTEDYHYRGDIGRYLREVSHGQGTLFLEPAGYIPYYSGLQTDDEVGLVSSRVTGYMLRDAHAATGDWWMAYVEAEKPTYIVQRESFYHYETFEGYTLTPEEQQWFDQHYRLIRRTHYEPWAYHSSQILRRILAVTSMPDYLVYERKNSAR